MIAIDTSALVAMLRLEPDEQGVRAKLQHAGGALMSMPNLLELQLVLADKPVAWKDVESILREYGIAACVFDERQLRVAREAAVRFGKGRHKAGLNFGDCFAYALAKTEDLPLLCTGRDFAATDLAIA